MKKNEFPYQDAFNQFLKKQGLANVTIEEYRISLVDLFTYLSNFNDGYKNDHRVSQLLDRDIEDYLKMLVTKRHIADLTYNKMLSHLNVYFKFLFQSGWNQHYPTVGIKGKGRAKIKPITTKWLDEMPNLLNDERLHFYTRMTLLLISHGYSEKEFLQPHFNSIFKTIQWRDFEKPFLRLFEQFIEPIQQRQRCDDIFLKQRFVGDAHMTLPGLHKFLRPDQALVDFSLNPSKLLQSYMIYYIKTHDQLRINELSKRLKVEPASILYYQNIIDLHLVN